jgi:putative peptidoglycan lipid II flippase
LPSLSTQAARGAIHELRETVNFGLRMVLFIILPSMVGLMLLRIPIIHLFFEHGAFSATDTMGTASALFGFTTGLWAFASYRILATAFYSLQDTKTPAIVAVITVGINIGLSLWLMQWLQHTGLALATALAAIANTLILITILGNRLQGLLWNKLGISLLRTGTALLPLIAISSWVTGLPIWQEEGYYLEKAAWLTIGILISAMAYFTIHQLFHSDEFTHLKLIFRRKSLRSSST